MKLILLGAPGAGKGTQAEVISEKLNIPQISTGNILREEIKRGTELGLAVKSLIESGELVPDKTVIELLEGRIARSDCVDGFILDGFPRTIAQAEALEAICDVDAVLEIFVPDEKIIARMSGRRTCPSCGATYHTIYNPPKQEDICDACGGKLVTRADDRAEVVRQRLDVYHAQTEPLIAFYKGRRKLRTVEGQDELADTTRLTLEALGIK